MKKISLVTVMLASGLLLTSIQVLAKNKVIHAKCYLELVGGGFSVNYFSLPAVKSNKIDLATISRLQVIPTGGRKKQSIYKVLECVKEDRLFTNSKANKLERNSVW